MDHLPINDIAMLVSSINFLLRDGEFVNLDDICSHFSQEPEAIVALLASGGYEYSVEQNRVI
ncbi:MAG: DUF4250 domain-containing protein [Bacteroidales bacterium]|nr:DUF4250 domain-containing protein [Bacteroidales bacterium]